MAEKHNGPPLDFLSSRAEAFVPLVKAHFAPFFDLAKKYSDLGMKVLAEAVPGKDNNVELVAALLFGRALTSFQAAYLLVERGLPADARTVIRAMAETSIVVNALAVNKDLVLELLTLRHVWHRRKVLNSWLADPQALEQMTAEQVAAFHAEITEIDAGYPKAKANRDPINIAVLAQDCGLKWLYNTVFRMHSGDSAHASLLALDRHVYVGGESSEITALHFGPDRRGIPNTLSSSISALAPSMMMVINLFQLSARRETLEEFTRIWQALEVPADADT